MFPVVSILRRAAANIIYVRPENLKLKDGKYVLPVSRKVVCMDLEAQKWGKKKPLIHFYLVQVTGSDEIATAKKLAKWENELAAKHKFENGLYTLLVGPESEEAVEGVWTRRVRFAAIRGVHRAVSEAIEHVPGKNLPRQRFRRHRKEIPGIIREIR